MWKYILLLLFPYVAFGQGTQITTVTADPPTCNTGMLYFNSTTNILKNCGPNNTWSSAAAGNGVGSGAGPVMAVYLSPQCPVANTVQCLNTPADTQQSQACSWTAATPSTVTCGSQVTLITGFVNGSNVAQYTTSTSLGGSALIPPSWAPGDSVTITGFPGGDAYFNQTCTITSLTATTVVCPLVHATGSSTTTGIITDTTVPGPFVAGDVGKQVMGWHDCEAFQTSTLMGTNAITVNGAPVITSFISSKQVQITTAANAMSTQTGCFIWGHPDDTAITAAENAWVNYPFCPKVELAASNYLLTKPHFYNNPLACQSLGTSYPNAAGNTFYSAGFTVEGRGSGNTIIYLATNFPNGDTCTRGPNADACFTIPVMGDWRNFEITGGSQPGISSAGPGGLTGTHALVFAVVATLQNITCTNWGAFTGSNGTPNMIGLERDWQVQTYQYNNSGCGETGEQINTNRTGNVGIRDKVENSLEQAYFIGSGGEFLCYECASFSSQNNSIAQPSYGIVNNGGTVRLYHGIFDGGSFNTQTGANQPVGYFGEGTNPTLIADNSFFTPANATNWTGIRNQTAGTTTLHNTTAVAGSSAGNSYIDIAASVVNDQGGNTVLASKVSLLGQWLGEANSANATVVTAAKLVLSAGWGSTAANTALTGGDFPIQFTITNSGTGQGASPTITYTFPTPLIVAPFSCTATQTGGTNAIGTFTTSSLTATGATFTFSLTPTGSSTEIVQVTCVTP